MFLPVSIRLGAGAGGRETIYRRVIETSSRFDKIARDAEDMTVPLTRVGEDLHTQIAAAFATQGSSGASGRWKQLSPGYRAWKERRVPGVPILVGIRPERKGTREHSTRPQTYRPSGLMRRQMLTPLSDRATWHVSPKRLLYTPLSDYAGFHQTGASRMPARPPVDVTLTFLHSVDRTFHTWMVELLDRAGLAGPGSG